MKFSLSSLSKLGKSLMLPIAVLPAAGLMLRLGQADLLNITWLANAGGAIFDQLPLLFALGIAIGFAEDNNGTAALAGTVGFLVLTKVATTIATANNPDYKFNMGAFSGIIAGLLGGYIYNRFKDTRLPAYLGFFGGKRFVPILMSFISLILGIIFGFVWPPIQNFIQMISNAMTNFGAFGGFLYGTLNRALIPTGLHHVLNTVFWFQFGSFTDAAGKTVTGDLWRFFAKDPTAGNYMAGFFPIMMFGLPAACLAMITTAKAQNRKYVTGMLFSVALTSFLTGITEPIEFMFIFLAPVLYGIHAVLTGISMAISQLIGMKLGFTFSAGFFDYILGYGISTKPLLLFPLGLAFGVIYYILFVFFIKKFDLPTPGRLDDEEESYTLANLSNEELSACAVEILAALGGRANVASLDACITRVRLTAVNGTKVDEAKLKTLGIMQVMRMGDKGFQLVVGTIADPLANCINKAMKGKK